MVAVMNALPIADELASSDPFDDSFGDPFGDWDVLFSETPRLSAIASPAGRTSPSLSPGLPTRRTDPSHLRLVSPGRAVPSPRPGPRPQRVHTPAPSRSNRARAGLYWRRRLVAAAVLVVGIGAAARAGAALGGAPLASSERPSRVVEYVVHPGDTVWSIARQFHPDGDPRGLVDRLVAQHGGDALRVGDVLRVPVG